MKKFYILLLLVFGCVINAQLKEVRELREIESKYDSILVNYQIKATDSLANLKEKDRNKIMASKERKILERKRKDEYAQLEKIRKKELELSNDNTGGNSLPCQSSEPFKKPNTSDLFDRNLKYKPTISKTDNRKESYSEVTFIVSKEGWIENVNAVGTDRNLNKQVEIAVYRIEKFSPSCLDGFSQRTRFKMPVRIVPEN